jgi:hypothetical protein
MPQAWFRFAVAVLVVAATLAPGPAAAQEMEPAAYWPLPTRLNVLTFANSLNWGDVNFDPALPIEDARATINGTIVAFTRTFGFLGRAANLTATLPIVVGDVEGIVQGTFASVDRFGPGDVKVRLASNLIGARAMTPKEAAGVREWTVLGTSVAVVAPTGQYDEARFINLGANRWAFKPELGVSHAAGNWVLEGMMGVWLFTDNPDFVGRTRSQAPLGSAQVHVGYRFRPSLWLAGDMNFYFGGRTTVDGVANLDFQKNSRVGATLSITIDRRQALRFAYSRGAFTNIGADFNSLIVGYNLAWIR